MSRVYLLFSSILITLAWALPECSVDDDCRGFHYCNSTECLPCFDCLHFFSRVTDKYCPKSFQDCGRCIDSYEEVERTFPILYKTCMWFPSKETRCYNDSDCAEGSFCIEPYCRDCLSCSSSNREDSEKYACVKDHRECGSCLPGFEEKVVLYPIPHKVCEDTEIEDVEEIKENGCNNHTDCPKGNFCYKTTCVDCLDCKLYNRRTSDEMECVIDFRYCGACLDGYEDVPVFSGSPLKPCLKPFKLPSPSMNQNTEVNVNVSSVSLAWVVCAAVSSLVILLTVVGVAYKIYVRKRAHLTAEAQIPSPYCVDEPNITSSSSSEADAGESTFGAVYKGPSNGEECMAFVCRLPEYEAQRMLQHAQTNEQPDSVDGLHQEEASAHFNQENGAVEEPIPLPPPNPLMEPRCQSPCRESACEETACKKPSAERGN